MEKSRLLKLRDLEQHCAGFIWDTSLLTDGNDIRQALPSHIVDYSSGHFWVFLGADHEARSNTSRLGTRAICQKAIARKYSDMTPSHSSH